MQIPNEVSQAAVSLGSAVVVGLLGILTAKVTNYLKALKNESLQRTTTAAFNHVSDVAEQAVLNVKQTLTDDLKVDGKLNKEDAKKALSVATVYFINHVSEGMLETVEDELGGVDDWIYGLLESKLAQIKK